MARVSRHRVILRSWCLGRWKASPSDGRGGVRTITPPEKPPKAIPRWVNIAITHAHPENGGCATSPGLGITSNSRMDDMHTAMPRWTPVRINIIVTIVKWGLTMPNRVNGGTDVCMLSPDGAAGTLIASTHAHHEQIRLVSAVGREAK